MSNAPSPLIDYESVAVGDSLPKRTVEDVTVEDFVKYAGASGDFNPIHYDADYAREAGFPDVFGQGMFTSGVAAGVLADWLGLENVSRYGTRFTAQLWPGDTLSVTGSVTETHRKEGPEEARLAVDVEFAVENGDGKTLVTGDATAEVPLPDGR